MSRTVDVRRYLGVPWVEDGRTLQGMDCVGLHLDVLRTQLGIDVPDPQVTVRAPDVPADWLARFDEVPVDQLRLGDAIESDGRPHHVATVLDGRRVLTTTRETGVVVAPLLTYLRAVRVLHCWRARAVAGGPLAPGPGAVLRTLDSSFGGPGAAVHVAAGTAVLDALRAHWPASWSADAPPPLVVVVNGAVESNLRRVLAAGDFVTVYPRAGIPVPAFIVAAAASIGVSAGTVALVGTSLLLSAVSYGLSALLAPDAPSVPQGRNERPVYRWDTVATEYRGYGATIPVSYGEQIVGGTVISYAVRTRGNKSVLQLLLCVGHGPLQSIAGFDRAVDAEPGSSFTDTDFRLNGTPVQEWGDLVKVSLRLGEVNQRAIPGFAATEATYSVGQRVKYVPPAERDQADPENRVTYRMRGPADEALLRFTFPQGLVWINGDGESNNASVRFRVRYRLKTADPTDPDSYSEWVTFRFIGAVSQPIPRDYAVRFRERGDYVLYVERLTPDPITTEGLASKSRSELSSVVEITDATFEYPGLGLVAFEITAVDGLSGSQPGAEIPLRGVKAMIPDDDDQDGAHTRTWTRSPFWVAYDLLRNTEYGLGDATRDMLFDVADWRDGTEDAAELIDSGLATVTTRALAADDTRVYVASTDGWAVGDAVSIDLAGDDERFEVVEVLPDALGLSDGVAEARAAGATVTKLHPRYEFDGTIDGSGSPWDLVQQILASARSRLVKQGNRFILIRSVPREPVMLICEGNGADDFVETREDPGFQPNALDLQFWNRADRYQRDNRLVLAADAITDEADADTFFSREALRPTEEQAFGISRPEQIDRHGGFRLRQLRETPRGWACTLPLEAVVARIGNVVLVAHRVVIAETWSGRTTAAAASGSSAIRLDQAVTLVADTTYAVRVRVGTSATAVRTITSPAGSYARGAALAISGAWPGAVDAGAPYALGLQGQETTPAEIVAYALREDFRVAVVTKQYVEANLAD